MLYEDLIYLWLSFLIYEFLPSFSSPFSFSVLIIIFLIKEFFFFSFILLLRKKIPSDYISTGSILEKFLIFIVFVLYFFDLTFFNLKSIIDQYYFSSLIAFLWFLHYFLAMKIFLFRFTFNYLKLLSGLVSPILVLIAIENILDLLGIAVKSFDWLLLFFILFFAPVFMIKLWPVYPLKDGFLRDLILLFLKKNKVKVRDIYVLGDIGRRVYTAGVVGFPGGLKYLFFSQHLLDILTPEEILGVVAHEIGHIKKKHAFWLLLLIINLPLFLMTILLFILSIIHQIYPNFIEMLNKQHRIYLEIEIGTFFTLFAYIYIRYIFSFFLRQFEREADLQSLILIKDPRPLVSALFKIGEITGQLYKKSWHHYGIYERIEFLKHSHLNFDTNQIRKQSFKIRWIIIFWILINFLISSVFYSESIANLVYKFLGIQFLLTSL